MTQRAAIRVVPAQRWFAASICIGVITAAVVAPVRAEYPERLIRAIVPFATGGVNDITARLIAPQLSKALSQTVVVDNRPGAAGNIGVEALARSAPDGYTILFGGAANTQNPALFRNMHFDPLSDIQPVAVVFETPYVIAVNGHLPVKNLLELIRLARRNPGKLNASAGGIGTRLSVELFKLNLNLGIEIIPYNGTGPASLAVAAGEADLAITDASGFMAYLSSGRIKLLAVAGDKRLPSFPDVPTVAEAGVPGYRAGATIGVFAAGKTPASIVQTLNATINKITAIPDVKEQIHKLGGSPAPKSVDEFTQWYRREIQQWKDIVARVKIPPVD